MGNTASLTNLRVALVHDWLVGMRGGERVLEELCRLFPQATVYSFFHERGAVSPTIESHSIRTSGINRIPLARRFHRAMLPVLPIAADALRIDPCDLVISTSHCVAGSVRAPGAAPHVSICFTPMRYLWGMERDYVGAGLRRMLLRAAAVPLRAWDRRTSDRVTRFVAISEYVRERIRVAYGRDADVVFPPVDVERFRPLAKPQDYFLVVSALVPYKRIDLVVEAFRRRSEEVWIAGSGPVLSSLRRSAPPNVRFLGWVPDEALPEIVAGARALLFPTEDEFGIVPVEAQAAGRPVIALGRGGAAETVIPPGRGAAPTGIWFERQSAAGLVDAIDRFVAVEHSFDPEAIRRHALAFSPNRFRAEILSLISETLDSGSS